MSTYSLRTIVGIWYNYKMHKKRSPEKLKNLLRDYIGVTVDLIVTFLPAEITNLTISEPDIFSLWQHIVNEDERTRRQLGSLRLKERLSQIPSYKEQEEIIGPILWEKLYGSSILS